ncbi:hypothetical protein [Ekhidna sp.]
MELKEQKGSGLALIIGSILMIATMVLHPVGGDFNHLLSIVTIGMVSHSIAIISVPFVAYGFWGLTARLSSESFLSKVGFSIMFFGLIAVMIAAATNGIILMDFVKSYEEASKETLKSLAPIFVFIRSFNHAFDFIFIGAVCISTLLWSISIVRTKKLAVWLGWFGISISLLAVLFLTLGFVFVDLHGFRLFIFGWVAWVVAAGLCLLKK